jgi:N-methylhydantoinase B
MQKMQRRGQIAGRIEFGGLMSGFDAVQLGSIWRRLNGMMDEAAETFVRTSFSPVVRDNWDFAFALMDAEGRQIVQSRRSVPSFIATMPRTLKAMLDVFPKSSLNPGDVLISNDPWLGTGHLNDTTMMRPIFLDDKIIGFLGSVGHHADIGGSASPHARDCFEEGIFIPVSKIVEGGRENRTVVSFIEQNVRQPDENMGDLRAQFASYTSAEAQIRTLLKDESLSDLQGVTDSILQRSSRSLSDAIAALPDGEYANELYIDGYDDEPLVIRCRITVKGSQLTVDYAGTSAQVDRPINCVMNYTHAYTCYALKCILDPGAPINDASFRSVTVTAPEGSLVNPRRPASVWGRSLTGHYLPFAVFGAVAKIAPDRVIADCAAPVWNCVFRRRDSNSGKTSVQVFPMNGGHGARPHMDAPACLSFPSNLSSQSIEHFEQGGIALIREKTFVADTAGAGRFRGGPAQCLSFEIIAQDPVVISFRHERRKNPPRGLAGGQPGTVGIDWINGEVVAGKTQATLKKGDVLRFQTPGGGGMFPPSERSREAVMADIANGIYTAAESERKFGVA